MTYYVVIASFSLYNYLLQLGFFFLFGFYHLSPFNFIINSQMAETLPSSLSQQFKICLALYSTNICGMSEW